MVRIRKGACRFGDVRFFGRPAVRLGDHVFGGRPYLLAAAVIVYFIGVWSADVIMRETNTEDPGQIVIDEVVGQWLALLATPLDPFGYAIGFLLFRFFDILKPWPACWADSKLHSATGVMLDDVFAGLYALICTVLINHFLCRRTAGFR